MRRVILSAGLVAAALPACGKKDKKKATVNTEVRSTGSLALQELGARNFLTTNSPKIFANSDVNLEVFKMPIGTISLAAGYIQGGGGTTDIVDIYSCPGAKDADCMVDLLAKDSVEGLLKASTELTASDKEFRAFSVGHCHENPYKTRAIVKGTVDLAGTTYYTHTTDGLSTTGPAEEVEVPMGSVEGSTEVCGSTTHLQQNTLKLTEGAALDLVIYTDPSSVVYATTQAGMGDCVGTQGAYLCVNDLAIYGSPDTKAPTVERYLLEIDGGEHNDLLLSILSNSAEEPYGGIIRNLFRNEEMVRTLPKTMSFPIVRKNADGTVALNGRNEAGEEVEALPTFTRGAHSGKLPSFVVDPTLDYSATKLD